MINFPCLFSMAFLKVSPVLVLIVTLLASALLLVDAAVHEQGSVVDQSSSATTMNCDLACDGRCRLSSRQKMCKRACGTCCARCNCVPPGTYGNKEVCPCYAQMTTHGGRPKCP